MRRHANAVRIGGVLALAAVLAACQATPRPPLLSPLDEAKRYGYTERELAPDRLEVSYLGPRHHVASYVPMPRDADTQSARSEAFDLASWRVAQLALTRGYAGFRIVDRDTQVDSTPEAFYAGPEWGGPVWRYPGGLTYGAPGFYATPYLRIQVRTTLTVVLLRTLEPGDEDAHAVIERRRAARPHAEAAAPPAG